MTGYEHTSISATLEMKNKTSPNEHSTEHSTTEWSDMYYNSTAGIIENTTFTKSSMNEHSEHVTTIDLTVQNVENMTGYEHKSISATFEMKNKTSPNEHSTEHSTTEWSDMYYNSTAGIIENTTFTKSSMNEHSEHVTTIDLTVQNVENMTGYEHKSISATFEMKNKTSPNEHSTEHSTTEWSDMYYNSTAGIIENTTFTKSSMNEHSEHVTTIDLTVQNVENMTGYEHKSISATFEMKNKTSPNEHSTEHSTTEWSDMYYNSTAGIIENTTFTKSSMNEHSEHVTTIDLTVQNVENMTGHEHSTTEQFIWSDMYYNSTACIIENTTFTKSSMNEHSEKVTWGDNPTAFTQKMFLSLNKSIIKYFWFQVIIYIFSLIYLFILFALQIYPLYKPKNNNLIITV